MQVTGEPKPGGYIEIAELGLIDKLPDGPIIVFDVGANIGDFTQAVLERRPEARVLAFEAQQDARLRLTERFGSRVEVLGALGERSASREFFTDGPASQLGTFFPRLHVPQIQSRSVGWIAVTTIDDVCVTRGITHVDLMKLDCEGDELRVLRGAVNTLSCTDLLYWEMLGGPTRYDNGSTMGDFVCLLADFEVETLRPMDPSDCNMFKATRQR
jgi:FkbM family methyltransferase